MPKTVSATEVKNKLGSVISWVLENQDEVIVESRGTPTVVIMPYAAYEKVKDLRERDKRRETFEQLRRLRDRVLARNRDLDPEEADALANRFSRDIIEGMVEGGKIRFEDPEY
jgi:prevent-host-death family protein